MADSNNTLDATKVRDLFPAFDAQNLKGQAFFENAGGSYTCKPVLDKLETYYRNTRVQPYSPYPASIAAGKAMDLSYERIGEAMGLPQEWIHFGPSTSANAYVLSHAFATMLSPGDAIIVTNQDHEANSGFWRRLENVGIEVREWQMDPQTGTLNIVDLENLLDKKVRFVSFPHCSNIVGEINPAKKICAAIHAAGALAIVDGVSYAPHGLPDVGDMDADIYFFSAYKTFGPHLGAMAIRPDIAMRLPVQGHHFNHKSLRYRLTPAGPDHAQIAAMSGIADYLEIIAQMSGHDTPGNTPFQQAHNAMRATEIALMQPLLDWLGERNDIDLIGPEQAKNRAPTIALSSRTSGFDLAKKLAKHNIMAGGGSFYAQRTLEGLNLDPEHGVLRLSFVHYTTENEIDQLISALSKEL